MFLFLDRKIEANLGYLLVISALLFDDSLWNKYITEQIGRIKQYLHVKGVDK